MQRPRYANNLVSGGPAPAPYAEPAVQHLADGAAQRSQKQQAFDNFDEQEHVLDKHLRSSPHRGIARGYARPEVDRSRALVVGCNYSRSRGMRLWGAAADARAWSSALSGRLGVPEGNVLLLADETEAGLAVDESSSSFPSQRNILDGLNWLTHDTRPEDLLVFIFCGRGTLLLGGSDAEDVLDQDEDDDEEPAEEGLMCGDFESADWVYGYSSRIIAGSMVAQFWEALPRGASLVQIIDAENGVSMLPGPRRLDSGRIPRGVDLRGKPVPVLEALVHGVCKSKADVKTALREKKAATAAGVGIAPPSSGSDKRLGDRGGKDSFPTKRWLRSRLLWEVAAGEEQASGIEAEVQAFLISASGPGGSAFEAHLGDSRDAVQKQRGPVTELSPVGRRGVLTHCLLRALEELNYQATYYAMWWRAVRILLEANVPEQHFQLVFNDGTDPTTREAFEPVGAAEARAYARRAELEQVDDSMLSVRSQRFQQCCRSASRGREYHDGEAPFTPRGSNGSCGCSTPLQGAGCNIM